MNKQEFLETYCRPSQYKFQIRKSYLSLTVMKNQELLLHIQYLTLKFLVQTWPLYLNRQDWIMELLHPEREPYGYQSKSMA